MPESFDPRDDTRPQFPGQLPGKERVNDDLNAPKTSTHWPVQPAKADKKGLYPEDIQAAIEQAGQIILCAYSAGMETNLAEARR
jgi:hypothetical protein